MQNAVVNMCEKFHNDRLRNDRALGNRKSDNKKKKKKNNVGSAWRPVSGSKNRPTRPIRASRVFTIDSSAFITVRLLWLLDAIVLPPSGHVLYIADHVHYSL